MRKVLSDPLPEVNHLAKALYSAMKYAEKTRQKLEKDLGYSRGYVSKIFNGTVEMRARHIFEILNAIGVEPWEFFQLAFPPPASQGQEAGRESTKAVSQPKPIPESELDERIRKGLLKILMGIQA